MAGHHSSPPLHSCRLKVSAKKFLEIWKELESFKDSHVFVPDFRIGCFQMVFYMLHPLLVFFTFGSNCLVFGNISSSIVYISHIFQYFLFFLHPLNKHQKSCGQKHLSTFCYFCPPQKIADFLAIPVHPSYDPITHQSHRSSPWSWWVVDVMSAASSPMPLGLRRFWGP